MAVKEGNKAPDFKLTNQAGKVVSLKDLEGKNTIIYFYPKDNTPGCTLEAEGFRDFDNDLKKVKTVVIGVSPDSEACHQGFIEKFNLPFQLLADPEKKMLTAYDAFGEKVSYGKRTIGVIRSTVWIGPDLKVKKHWKKVAKAAEHPAEVLEALKAG
jgi:peroxiredoxin Q/BCP